MKKTISAIALSLLLLGGCATVTEAGYYWGNYSGTLYEYTKNPSESTLAAHKAELENIIGKSRDKQLRVPPGIHAELGYINAREGSDSQAMAHYENEMSLYPESRLFLERLTQTNDNGSDAK